MNSEKVKEIKECLEEFKDDRIGYCTNGIDRFMLTKEDALTLINELEEENETLRNAKVVHETVDYCAEDLRKANDRIAELEDENKSLYESYHKGYKVGYEYGKQDAISCDKAESDSQTSDTTQTDYILKQFAEKFKEKCIKGGIFPAFVANKLNETLKEFIQE